MTIPPQSCMGGWCAKRDRCPHFHAATPWRTPVERLCAPGRDGVGATHLVELPRPQVAPSQMLREVAA